MGNVAAIVSVISNNSKDVEEIVARFGGLGNVIKALPAITRIFMTISANKDPVEAAEQASRALLYSDETKEKVRAFQKRHGLDPDGLVGDRTWGAVEKLEKSLLEKSDGNG